MFVPASSSVCWHTPRVPRGLQPGLLAKFQCMGRVIRQRRASLGIPSRQCVPDQVAGFAIVVHDRDRRCRVPHRIIGDRRYAPGSEYVTGCVKRQRWHILQQFRASETQPGDGCGSGFEQRSQLHRHGIGTNTMNGGIQATLIHQASVGADEDVRAPGRVADPPVHRPRQRVRVRSVLRHRLAIGLVAAIVAVALHPLGWAERTPAPQRGRQP